MKNDKEYKKQYYLKNKEKINKNNMNNYYSKKIILENRLCKSCNVEFAPQYINKVFCTSRCGIIFWRKNNKEHTNLYFKNKYNSNLNRRLSSCLRSRLLKALKHNIKSQSTMQLLGCPIDQLKQHLESKFQEGMSWDNYSNSGWHIDHIIPLSSFDLTDIEELKKACHYTNLQPLWAKDNIAKGNRL